MIDGKKKEKRKKKKEKRKKEKKKIEKDCYREWKREIEIDKYSQ